MYKRPGLNAQVPKQLISSQTPLSKISTINIHLNTRTHTHTQESPSSYHRRQCLPRHQSSTILSGLVPMSRLYYKGLPSYPRLVARSSTEPWEEQIVWDCPYWTYTRTKSLSPPGRHPLVTVWNDSTGPLRREIIEALSGINWLVINILRLGYDRKVEAGVDERGLVTLLVSVELESVTWD